MRRQQQIDGAGGAKRTYSGVFDAMRSIHAKGMVGRSPRLAQFFGYREFFRGLAPELMKVIPGTALIFFVNEQILASDWPFGSRSM